MYKRQGLLLFCGILLAGIADGGLTAHGFICMGLLTLDITLEALKFRNEALNGLHSLMTAAFLNYGIFYLPLSLNRHLLIAALVFSGLYLLGRRIKYPLASPAGELLFTVLAFGDAALLFTRAVDVYKRQGKLDGCVCHGSHHLLLHDRENGSGGTGTGNQKNAGFI